jgi:hypothetical protein
MVIDADAKPTTAASDTKDGSDTESEQPADWTPQLPGIQKNMQQFEMCTTMEWLVGEVKGHTTGYRNVRNSQLNKQCALCKTVYSMECIIGLISCPVLSLWVQCH